MIIVVSSQPVVSTTLVSSLTTGVPDTTLALFHHRSIRILGLIRPAYCRLMQPPCVTSQSKNYDDRRSKN